jgi:hypothetical protein
MEEEMGQKGEREMEREREKE